MLFDDRLRRVLRVLKTVEFRLSEAKRLNELHSSMWGIDWLQSWIIEECEPDDVGIVSGADGTV